MKRILTGIQSTGTPHLGNILGAIQPAIEMAENEKTSSYLFIADFHSLTQVKNAEVLRENSYQTAAAWLACGLNPDKTVFYKQSSVPQVTELTWYLMCFFQYQRLTLAHSFKDKADRLSDVNAGLFNYPLLMAADILLYDANEVPVGKDQLQHLEITRDIANKINNHFQEELLVVPEPNVREETQIIPGIDGVKMSKSKGNTINVFLPEKKLRKQIMRIETDSTPLEEPKDPHKCNVFSIFKCIGSKSETKDLAQKYRGGNFGYGHAKQALFDLVLDKYKNERDAFSQLLEDRPLIDRVLAKGALEATKTAHETLSRIRNKMGY